MARFGFTTGSCAAAASKAAAYMLLTGKIKNSISIETPKGIRFDAEIVEISRSEKSVSCAVIKDGGDDPDITTGAHIFSKVSFIDDSKKGNYTDRIVVDGGTGVGRVTKPGLDQPVGNAAINSVPRKMIIKEVSEVMELCDYKGSLRVDISVPEGMELAAKTFNPRLGIVGGISILGTSGIVEPMSLQALLDTIRVELNQKKALGFRNISVAPGNYGLEFMKRAFDFDLDKSVKCSNFIGDTIDMVGEMDFAGMLFTGHIGKLAKIAGGMMNTHSMYGDNRMEVISSCAASAQAGMEVITKINDCVVTEDAVDILIEAGYKDATMDELLNRIIKNLGDRNKSNTRIECILYSNKHEILAKTAGAIAMLEEIKLENKKIVSNDL